MYVNIVLMDVLLLVILFIFVLLGLMKGLVRTIVNIASFFISGVLTFYLLPMVKKWIGFEDITGAASENININAFGADLIRKEITALVISAVIVVVLFLLIRFLFMLFGRILDIISDLPVLRQLNKIGGAALGVIQGFLIIYLALGVLFLVHHNSRSELLMKEINESQYATEMYNNNILLSITGLK